MMCFDTLSVLQRIALMFALFVVLCGSIHLLPLAWRRRDILRCFAAGSCAVVSAVMMVLYTADVRGEKKMLAPAAVSRWFCQVPIGYVIAVLAVIAVFLVWSALREIRRNRTSLTRSAIKESIDHLPTGLCFHTENGRVLLANHCMSRLCHALLGRDLQNAAAMWEDLCAGKVREGVVQLTAGAQPSFRMADGTVWTFARTKLDGVMQITAADTTQLHGLLEELARKNSALEALYGRLKEYEADVEQLTRERERLETKIGIHSELGQTLLATRSYLQDRSESRTVPVDAWKRSIALLRQNVVENAEQFTLETLIRTAAAFGIEVEVTGEMPREKEIQKLFLEAATEALTNAVRHADARTLRICFSENQVSFRNDGRQPAGKIREGGGLSALRRKIETAGGEMTTAHTPGFTLTITMKKEGVKEYDTGSDRGRCPDGSTASGAVYQPVR